MENLQIFLTFPDMKMALNSSFKSINSKIFLLFCFKTSLKKPFKWTILFFTCFTFKFKENAVAKNFLTFLIWKLQKSPFKTKHLKIFLLLGFETKAPEILEEDPLYQFSKRCRRGRSACRLLFWSSFTRWAELAGLGCSVALDNSTAL